MALKTIYVFGNSDLEIDSLPIKILPNLRTLFSEIDFKVLDPNEEWDVPENLLVIDTVLGIHKIIVFDDLKKFLPAPHVSMHDFDAYANLRYLQKLGKLKNIKIIGIPPNFPEKLALNQISDAINKIFKKRKKMRLPDFDYSKAGYYFVTICVKDRKCLFGEVKGGEIRLNQFGKIVNQHWLEISATYKNIVLDTYVIMPNHIHGIIIIDEIVGAPLVGARDQSDRVGTRPTPTLPDVVGNFKSMVVNSYIEKVKKEDWPKFNKHIFQRTFYDHVIRDEKSLEKIREYIQNNPLQWELDEENPKRIK